MAFTDLPKNIKQVPLTDPGVAGHVIDLIISEASRVKGCFGVMVCDDRARGLNPFVLQEVSRTSDLETVEQFLGMLLPLAAQVGATVLVGRGRAKGQGSGLRPDDVDREWHQRVVELCAEHDVRLLGFHVATSEGVFRLPEPFVKAS